MTNSSRAMIMATIQKTRFDCSSFTLIPSNYISIVLLYKQTPHTARICVRCRHDISHHFIHFHLISLRTIRIEIAHAEKRSMSALIRQAIVFSRGSATVPFFLGIGSLHYFGLVNLNYTNPIEQDVVLHMFE